MVRNICKLSASLESKSLGGYAAILTKQILSLKNAISDILQEVFFQEAEGIFSKDTMQDWEVHVFSEMCKAIYNFAHKPWS